MFYVDLNSDLGESFGAYTIGLDAEVIRHATSANVACGWHAGDPMVMEQTIALCKAAGTGVGAHPGYPDLMGFGRRNMVVSPAEVKAYMTYQLGALSAFCRAQGVPLQHVKPHGAFYNMAAKDRRMADAMAAAVKEFDPGLIFMGLAGSQMIAAAKDAGLKTASEVFADRAYEEDGTLVARSKPGAMIEDEELAMRRVIRMVKEGVVQAITGKDIPVQCDSVCVHGDNAHAVEFVRRIRAALTDEGVTVAPLSEFIR